MSGIDFCVMCAICGNPTGVNVIICHKGKYRIYDKAFVYGSEQLPTTTLTVFESVLS